MILYTISIYRLWYSH